MTRANEPENAKELDWRAERSLLGGLLMEPGHLARFIDDLHPRDFYRPEHGALYQLLVEMQQQGQGIDLVTVTARMGAGPRDSDRWGGVGYVATLPEACPSTENLRTYAAIVIENARVRRLRDVAAMLYNAACGSGPFGDMPSGEIADEWIPRLAELAAVRGAKKHTVSLREAWAEAQNERLDREAGALPPPVYTGFGKGSEASPGLDRLLALEAGDLVVIGGEPSMGKSALAQAFAMELAIQGAGVSYHSLEMGRVKLVRRLAAYVLHIPTEKLKQGDLTDQEEDDVARFTRDVDDERFPLHITDRPGVHIDQVAAEARVQWARGGLRAVFIDHLHLMNFRQRKGESKSSAIGDTTGAAKKMARELGVVVFLLSQLTREAARRPDPRKRRDKDKGGGWWEEVATPKVSDLRESGAIEADADAILFPIHASKCGIDHTPRAGAVIVAKQRDGRLGTVGVEWDGPCAAYRPYSQPLFDGVSR